MGLACRDAVEKFLRPSCGKGRERHCACEYISKSPRVVLSMH